MSWGAKRLAEEMVWGQNDPDSRISRDMHVLIYVNGINQT